MSKKPNAARIKRWIARSVERERTKRESARIRAALKVVRERKRTLVRQAREQCKRLKERTRASVKAYRAQERERINREAKRMRQESTNRCKARIITIRAGSAKAAEKQREIRRERAQEKRELAAAKERERIDRTRLTAAERRAESDDEVRHNLPAHLVPIFNKVRSQIKGVPGRITRTEAFLHWAEENPDVVQEAQIERAERETVKLIREQKKAQREEQRARRLKAAPLRSAERAEVARIQGKPKPPKKISVGRREGSALAITHEAWKDRRGWAEFDAAKEKAAIRSLAKKGLVKMRKTGVRVPGYGETLEGQITTSGLDVVESAVPF